MIQIKRNMKLYCLDTSINNYKFNSSNNEEIKKIYNKTNKQMNKQTKYRNE